MMIGPEGIDDSSYPTDLSENEPLPDDTEKTAPSDEELRTLRDTDPDKIAEEIEAQEE